MNTFGERLRAAREARGVTQEVIGFEVGVTKATVSKWETGRSEPTLSQLAMLAEVLQTTTDALVRNVAFWGVGEPAAEYDTRRAMSSDEQALLLRFRAESPTRRAALLELLKPTNNKGDE